MSVEKISTVLRKACEWSGRNPQFSVWDAISETSPLADVQFLKRLFDEVIGHWDYWANPTGRWVMLGLAAAIAESEGL